MLARDRDVLTGGCASESPSSARSLWLAASLFVPEILARVRSATGLLEIRDGVQSPISCFGVSAALYNVMLTAAPQGLEQEKHLQMSLKGSRFWTRRHQSV